MIYANSSIVFAHVSIVPKVAFCCFQGMKLSGLCFAGMLIHFRSGKFQVLDLSTFLAKVMLKFSVNFGMTCATN